jgi:hypothetical protein
MQLVILRRAGWLNTCCAVIAALVAACAVEATPPPSGQGTPAIRTGGTPAVPSGVAGVAAPAPFGGAGVVPMTPLNNQPPLAAGKAAPIPAPAGIGAPVPPPAGSPAVGAAGKPAVPGAAGAMAPVVIVSPNQKLPAVTNYDAVGPFPAREASSSTGPGGAYTIFQPTNLNANGFKFIPATWGNGITTTPQFYPWLSTVASHGFVIIAANTSTVTAADMTSGLDWLIAQNDMPGDLQGKLDTSRAVCIGYSLGGGASVSCGSHPKVIATIAMHPAAGLPIGLHGPLLLFSGTNDTVCVPETFVQPVFTGATVPTFFGMLDGADHLEPVLGGRETAPFIAWLRLWVFGDEGAKPFFYGADCKLCKAPWTKPQSKMLQ